MTAPIDPWLWPTSPVPNQRPATELTVSRWTPDEDEDTAGTYEVLDNLECVTIHQSMGIDPGSAVIRYRFTGQDILAPQSIQDALSTTAFFEKLIDIGDHIVITALQPDDETIETVFWGQPYVFAMELNASKENVPLTLIGIAKNAWDIPVDGLLYRDPLNILSGTDFPTDIPAQFNPKGLPNCTPAGAEVVVGDEDDDQKYPTFLDPGIYIPTDSTPQRVWTLDLAAAYFMFRYMELRTDTFLDFPNADLLTTLLIAREPIDGTAFDPTNPDTFTSKPILATDRPLSGRDWPGLLNDMIRDKGYGMVWTPGTKENGDPSMTLVLSLLQAGTKKDVYLQDRGSVFDPEQSNIGQANIERDLGQVVNSWEVIGALERYEVSLILACGFPMVSTDSASVDALATYDKASSDWAAEIDAYRLFIYDECGQGSYEAFSNSPDIGDPGDLDAILGAPEDGEPKYTKRLRKPIGKLLSVDTNGEPLRYSLAISTDYTGTTLAPYNNTGTWQTINGGYELLDYAIGIRITASNPNAWKIGKCDDDSAPYPAGVVNVVDSLAVSNTISPKFFLRLTICIDGDLAVRGIAEKTLGSPLIQIIERQTDARDRFKKETICLCSEHNTSMADDVIKDDTVNATAEAVASRVATEAGVLDGQIVIPRFTRYYKIGDRIQKIYGRELSFRTDNAADSNTNAPIYPIVTAIQHDLEGGQKTTLTVSDQDGHRYHIESKTRRH